MCNYKLTLVITKTTDMLDGAGWQMAMTWKKSLLVDETDRDKVIALRDLLNSGHEPYHMINALSNRGMWQWEWPATHSSEAINPLREVGIDWPGDQLPDIDWPSITLNLSIN